MNTNPFFIVGVPRSGTTLLAVLLNNHSHIYVGKTARGQSLLRLHRRIMETYGLDGDIRSQSTEERLLKAAQSEKLVWELCKEVAETAGEGLRPFIRCAIENEAARYGKPIWGNKSPFMLLQMPQLAHLVPGTRFVHVIRDGRAVAQSQKVRRNFHPRLAIHSWKQMILSGRIDGEIMGPCHYLEIQFEDLLQYPEEVLPRVCTFLDIEFEESMVDLGRAESTGQRNAYVKQTLDASKVDAWQEQLSQKEIEALESIAGDLLQALGYNLLYYPADGPFRMLSPLKAIWYHQCLHLNDLLHTRRVSMVNQQLVEISAPLPDRLRNYLRQSAAQFLSDGVIEQFRPRKIPVK